MLGDPALLLPYVFPECQWQPKPSRKICLILHNNDKEYMDNANFDDRTQFPAELDKTNIWNSTLDYHTMLERILECHLVVSSSLHGIIVAEAFGIPARWVKLKGSAKSEGQYKYCDYYTGSRYKETGINTLMRDNGNGECIGFDNEENPYKRANTVAEAYVLGGAPPIREYDSARLLRAFPLELMSTCNHPLIDPLMMIGANLLEQKGGEQQIALAPRLKKNRTLVILNGSPRGGETTWQSLYTQLLDVNQAELALAFGDSADRNSSLYSRAKYIWEFPEFEDWGVALDRIDTTWQRYRNRGNFMGGVRGSNGNITIGSGAILMWIRWFVKGKLQSERLLDQYDWFVYTRSDHFYYCPHDLRLFMKDPSRLYVPNGEKYGGYTDRHLVAHRDLIIPALSLLDNVMKTGKKGKRVTATNMEVFIKRCWQKMKLNVTLFDRMFFTCAVPGDKTRWMKGGDLSKTPEHLKKLGLALKYPNEFKAAERYCKGSSRSRW